MAITGNTPLPYKKTSATPNLGALDSSDDIRGGMGIEGLAELSKFVREGGTLIDYEDEDPQVRRDFEAAIAPQGIRCTMPEIAYR